MSALEVQQPLDGCLGCRYISPQTTSQLSEQAANPRPCTDLPGIRYSSSLFSASGSFMSEMANSYRIFQAPESEHSGTIKSNGGYVCFVSMERLVLNFIHNLGLCVIRYALCTDFPAHFKPPWF